MKKLVFMFVAVAAISLASCGGNNQAAGNDSANDSSVVAVDSADSANTDSAAADSNAAAPAAADTTAAAPADSAK